MRTLLLVPALLLAGCASVEELRATVGNASNFQLCRAIMLSPGEIAQIAREEAGRRRLDCSAYAGAVIQQQQAGQAANNAMIQRLLTPPAPAFQPTVNCTSYRMGNTVQTDCR